MCLVHCGQGQEVNKARNKHLANKFLVAPGLDRRCTNYAHTLILTQHVHTIVLLYRWDTSEPEMKYNTPPPEGKLRTLASLHQNCTLSRPDKHLGSKHPPLLRLEPSKYVLDELHLRLRVSDVLARNLIHFADHLDQQTEFCGGRTRHHIPNLEQLVVCHSRSLQ